MRGRPSISHCDGVALRASRPLVSRRLRDAYGATKIAFHLPPQPVRESDLRSNRSFARGYGPVITAWLEHPPAVIARPVRP